MKKEPIFKQDFLGRLTMSWEDDEDVDKLMNWCVNFLRWVEAGAIIDDKDIKMDIVIKMLKQAGY